MATLTLELNGIENAEQEALKRAVERARYIVSDLEDYRVSIMIRPREASGWLEYLISAFREDKHVITVGMIQRHKDAEFEFHS